MRVGDPMTVACPACLVGPGRLCRDAINETCDVHAQRVQRASRDELVNVESATAEAIAVWLESMRESDDDGTEFKVTRIGCDDAASMIRAGAWKVRP